jgi:uncharacterized protein (DUF427 family)
MLNDCVVAESDDVVVYESYHYFGRTCVRMEWLNPVDKTESDLACPHGVLFYDAVIDGVCHERVAWSYESPRAPLRHIAERMGFWKDIKVC